ncbi:pyruvate, water dikinase [Candidatus Curtissbacteria bacterium RIFCSPLOWO2_02_FULL_40_11]|nr:MAG: pyruvate, water dikinase [Candidatus Curtissbacteria bacterium RIFCSPLOWO2_02_FULL_40_11]
MQDQNIVWFSQVDKDDIQLVGGKGANLGELTKIKAPIPEGFIITSQAYFQCLKRSGAIDRIRGILYDLNVENPIQLVQKAKACQQEIKKLIIDKKLEKKIFEYYRKLSGSKNALVAVRSSATAEDLPQASFAGQQSTYLNILGKHQLKQAILNAWASLFEARAIFYRVYQNFDHFKVGLAIPVQKMIQAESSGVMFTLDPITNDKKKIIIEAIFGLGELIVGGRETPDHYEISKKDFEILDKKIAAQNKQLVYQKTKNKEVEVAKSHKRDQKLEDRLIIELAKIGAKIEKHYFFPQDIEWAVENNKVYITQTRPVTTLKLKSVEEKLKKKIDINEKDIILQGSPASPQIASGKVVIVSSVKEISKVKTGDILVTEMTNPDFVPAMKKAAAIVTDRGGRTSHAAIVARELGIACVVGTEKATRVLTEGMVITVDGSKGSIYKGQFIKTKKDLDLKNKDIEKQKKTATKLYVNLAEPDLAHQIAAKNVDGIGLLRAEFIMAQIGVHPKKYINDKKEEEFINILENKLSIFSKAFGSRPVIYRATDFKSNEYRNLRGGDKFEPTESNPMMGYRGAFRYIKDPDVFKLELKAIKNARNKFRNLHLMIPFVRTVNELRTVRKIVDNIGLFKDKSFEFYMMVEIPSNVILLEDYIRVGLSGVSIGSNDLTMLLLGTDRDNEEVANEYNELDASVLWALKKTIETASRFKIKSSICGQGPSVYPELIQKLVKWGISSISVSPDAVENTRNNIYEAELKKLSN